MSSVRRLPIYDDVNDFSLGTFQGDAAFNQDVWETEVNKGISITIINHYSEIEAIKRHEKLVNYLQRNPINYDDFMKNREQVLWEVLRYRRRNFLDELGNFKLAMERIGSLMESGGLCANCYKR